MQRASRAVVSYSKRPGPRSRRGRGVNRNKIAADAKRHVLIRPPSGRMTSPAALVYPANFSRSRRVESANRPTFLPKPSPVRIVVPPSLPYMDVFRRASSRPAVAPGIPGPRPAPAAARNGRGSRPFLRQPHRFYILLGFCVRVDRIARASDAGMLVRNGAVCQRSLSTGS